MFTSRPHHGSAASPSWTVRRALLAASAVVVPCLVLIVLGVVLVSRQRRALDDLVALNRRLAGERLTLQIERSVTFNIESGMTRIVAERTEKVPPGEGLIDRVFWIDASTPEPPTGTSALEARLQRDLHFSPTRIVGRVFPLAYTDPPVQMFYTAVENRPRGQLYVVVTLSPDAVRSQSLEQARFITGIKAQLTPAPAIPSATAIHFPVLFPFWQLEVQAPPTAAGPHQILILLSVMILGVGVLLLACTGILVRTHWQSWALVQQRTRFVGGVSHDLRHPLANIRLSADLLRTTPIEAERNRYCDTIVSETARLTNHIENVLQFASIETSTGARRFILADLRDVLQRAVDQWREILSSRGFEVALDLPGEPVCANVDQPAVIRAIGNLVDNAAKYSRQHRRIAVAVAANASYACIEVADHGAGIPGRLQDRIFDPFFRASNTDTTGGFGLGLFLVAQTMREHGGAVEVESEPERGSTFRLRFPLA